MIGVRPMDISAAVKARDPVAAREKLAESALFGKILLEASRTPDAMKAKGQTSITALFTKK